MSDELLQRSRIWADGDVDVADQAELRRLIDALDVAALHELMGSDITFGTAGLRAAMAPGANRMNRATVIRATYAVAQWLDGRLDGEPTVVVGCDARHNSATFLQDVVAVLAAHGVRVWRFARPVPTPLVAFAQKQLHCDAAIVVTASHNPATDNGYKLYGAGAAQIVTPDDTTIQQLIATGPLANAIARHDGPHAHVRDVDDGLYGAYEAMVLHLHRPHAPTRPKIVYTPLHGVGAPMFLRVANACGYDDITVVASQADPDPDFPTVKFPNPEEPGALDAAHHVAVEVGADLVIANDPDADRLAISVPDGTGGFQPLTGNDIGVLLTDYLLTHTTVPRPLIVTTVVSTPMVTTTAERHGAHVERTLTGFKWIARAVETLRHDGYTFVYGFEEALGSNVTQAVNDKDGISAGIVFADFVTWLLSRGETVKDRLATLGVVDGVWVSRQVSITRPGNTGGHEIRDAMRRLIENPPTTLGSRQVIAVNDYTSGGQRRPVWRAEDLLVELVFADGRILVRPSGTEPKLKTYVDLQFTVTTTGEVEDVRRHGAADATQLAGLLLTQIGIV